MKSWWGVLAVAVGVSSVHAAPAAKDEGTEILKAGDIRVLELVSADDRAVTVQDTETKQQWKVSREYFGSEFDFRPGYQFAWTMKDLERASLKPEKNRNQKSSPKTQKKSP